jgi:type IV pilus assembly protein PilO
MKITSMQKMIMTVLALLIVAALVVVFLIMPKFTELDTLSSERTDANLQLQQAKAVLAQLEGSKSKSAQTEAAILKIGTQMPDSPQLPTLIIELQDIANAAGVTVTSFSPAQPTPASGGQYTEISMTLQLTATWDDMLDYMRRLNKATRLLRTTSVTINPASTDTSSTAGEADAPLTVALTVKAYVIGTNGVVSSAATATTTP